MYRATVSGAARSVAVKRFAPSVVDGAGQAEALASEIARASALRHPNIVATYRASTHGGIAFVEMEHVRGVSIEELLHDIRMGGPPPVSVVTSLVAELCDALACAHRAGLVHGDIAPSHLLIDGAGHLRVVGFGLGRLAPPAARRSYAAPEVLMGAAPNAQSDVFSAGVIAYELITGRPLFDDNIDPDVRALVSSCIATPSVHNGTCPVAFEQVIMRAIASSSRERWSSASDMRIALAPVGGPDAQVVSDWLRVSADSGKLPAVTPPPLSVSPRLASVPPPPPPPRAARGSGRMDSAVTPDPTYLDLGPSELYEPPTVLRPSALDGFSDLQLPIEAPPEPYVVLEEDIEDDVPIIEDFVLEQVEARYAAPTEPSPPSSSPPEFHAKLPRPGLSRRTELALAFAAGALALYLLQLAFG